MRITFTGDIMIEQPQLEATGQNFDAIFEPIKDYFKKTDILVGNLETPIAGKESGYTAHKWSFNTPETLLDTLKAVGFSILSTANNHCLDRGYEGAIKTIENIRRKGIKTIGTYANPDENHYLIEEVNGYKIAILSFTYGTNSVFNRQMLPDDKMWIVDLLSPQEKPNAAQGKLSRYNIPLRLWRKVKTVFVSSSKNHPEILVHQIDSAISEARNAGADKIIFLSHMGGQYGTKPSVYSEMVVNHLLEKGVDYIVGNHEHTVQKSMRIDDKFVAYCLGNFAMSPNSDAATSDVLKKSNADVSILLHLDFLEESTSPIISFQVVKNVLDSHGISRVYLLHDLIEKEESDDRKKALIKEYTQIASRFSGRAIVSNSFEHLL